MQNSNAVVKKIYCIVINGKIQENVSFVSLEKVKTFSLRWRQVNTITIREMYRVTTDIIIREIYPNVD